MTNTDFRYTRDLCPVCNENFKPEDDIVVCPLCGTPHHRDCYKKNGECAHSEKHSEGYRWESTPIAPISAPENTENSAPPFNPYANQGEAHNSRDAASTVFWGNQPGPFDAYPKELDEGVATEEAAEFVQMNAHKYIPNFFYLKSKKRTFNWAAFFFAPYWFFYRKLYKLGVIFLAVMLLMSVAFSLPPSVQKFVAESNEWYENYGDVSSLTEEEMETAATQQKEIYLGNPAGVAITAIEGALSLAIQLFIGFKANKWYYNHTVSKIRQIKAEFTEPEIRKLNFYKQGGMSMSMAFLAVLANNMIVMAINMLFTALNI